MFSRAAADSVDGLTDVMILHPIACFIAFLAFALSLGAGVIGSVIGALVALVAWVLTVVVMAIDFSLFGVGLIFRSFGGTMLTVTTDRQRPRQQAE